MRRWRLQLDGVISRVLTAADPVAPPTPACRLAECNYDVNLATERLIDSEWAGARARGGGPAGAALTLSMRCRRPPPPQQSGIGADQPVLPACPAWLQTPSSK